MGSRFVNFRTVVVGALLLILGGTVGYRYGTGVFPFTSGAPASSQFTLVDTLQPNDKKDVKFQQFWEVWRMLEQQYVDPSQIDVNAMVDGAIRGMTAGVGDPYTLYLSSEQNKQTAEQLRGSFFGVGIQLGYVESTLAAIAPLDGSPAAKAGVQPGDLILHVKDEAANLDEDTQDWSLEEAVSHIRGPRNSIVTLTLYRKDAPAPFTVDLKRDEVIIPSVTIKYVEYQGKKIANVRLSTFNERTDAEWNQAVESILAEKPMGIILDMRNNPGGLFDTAIDVVSDFIPTGIVVTQQGKTTKQDFKSTGTGRLAEYEVEVLVNKGSASASEIVAGALRDRNGAKLIGEKTFGKGTVQDRQILSNGGALHVTIAKWLLPSGQWIHHEGIPVDIEVKDDPATADIDEALQKAIETL